MITDDDIAEARQDLEDAISAFAQVEALGTSSKMSYVDVGVAWAAARSRIEQATARLARVEHERRVQEDAEAARVEVEKQQAKQNAQRAGALDASEDRVTACLTAVQDTLVDLLDVLGEHNAAVAETVAEMAVAGLTPLLPGREVGCDPKGRVALLSGRWWREVDPEVLLAQVVERTRLARLSPAGYEVAVRRFATGHVKNKIAADLLALVPDPALADEAPRVTMPPRPLPESPVFFASDWAREEAERRNREAYETRPLRTIPGPDGKPLPFDHHAYKTR